MISLLTNPAVTVLIGALAGGIVSFISTFYFNSRQRNIQSKRLRRALTTEIKSLEILQLRIAVRTMQSQGIIQQTIEDQLVSMAEETLGEMSDERSEDSQNIFNELSQEIIQQAAPEAFEKVELFLATPIYENNTDKIGLLDSDEIEQLVNFNRHLDLTRDEIKRIIATANDSDNSKLQSRLQTLEKNLKELESMRDDVLNTLGANTEELQHSEELLSEEAESGEENNIENSEETEHDKEDDLGTSEETEHDEEDDFETETAE